MRCAHDLTEPARKRIEAERDAEIAAKKAEGKKHQRRSPARWTCRKRPVRDERPASGNRAAAKNPLDEDEPAGPPPEIPAKPFTTT